MRYLVNIIKTGSGEIVESLGIMSLKAAQRVERGVNINLNHNEYHTEIEEVKSESNGEQNTTDPSQ